jgi:FkbM family methyltransferase
MKPSRLGLRVLAKRWLPPGVKVTIRQMLRLIFYFRYEFLRHPPYLVRYQGYDVIFAPGNALVYRLAEGNGYEPEILSCALEHLPSNAVVIDVGANIGLFTMAVARHCPAAEIHCFEPSPHPRRCLAQTIVRNGLASRIELNEMALYSHMGELEFRVHDDLRHAAGDGLRDTGRAGPTHAIRVPVTTLDAYCKEKQFDRLDLIKIDTEGAELHVLQGASNVLTTLKPAVIFEASPLNTVAYDVKVKDIFSLLEKHHYGVWTPEGEAVDKGRFVNLSHQWDAFVALPLT